MIFQMQFSKMKPKSSKFFIWLFRWKFPKWNLQVPFSKKLSEESNKKVGTFRFHFWNLHLKNHCFYYLFGKKGTFGNPWQSLINSHTETVFVSLFVWIQKASMHMMRVIWTIRIDKRNFPYSTLLLKTFPKSDSFCFYFLTGLTSTSEAISGVIIRGNTRTDE